MFLDTENLHHAYLIEGERAAVLAELFAVIEKDLKISTKANPDFLFREFDALAIDDAREIKARQLNKSVGDRQIFVVAANSIAREAQNSLLKVFEEPTASSHFFLVMPSGENLLPTLRSRLMIVKTEGGEGEGQAEKGTGLPLKEALDFLKSGPTDRLNMVKELVDAIADEEKTKTDALTFVNAIEFTIHKKLLEKPEQYKKMLEEILKCRSFLQDRSSSVKMILEHLALTL